MEFEADEELERQSHDIQLKYKHFQIQKQLKKKIHEYSESANLPHVKVAKDMVQLFGKTESQLLNHFIPYVITTGEGNQADKALHFGEFMQLLKTTKKPQLDFDFYKKNQLINPLERLLQPVDSGLHDQINLLFGY